MVYRSEISGAQQMFCALLLSHTSSSSDTRSEAETTQICDGWTWWGLSLVWEEPFSPLFAVLLSLGKVESFKILIKRLGGIALPMEKQNHLSKQMEFRFF